MFSFIAKLPMKNLTYFTHEHKDVLGNLSKRSLQKDSSYVSQSIPFQDISPLLWAQIKSYIQRKGILLASERVFIF